MSESSVKESTVLRDSLVASLEKAYGARQTLTGLAGTDSTTMSPEDLHQRLLASRKVVDVLENELVLAILAKSRVDRLRSSAEADVEDAEIANAGTKDDYMSSRDRAIDINSRTLQQRRAARQSAALAVEAQATVRALQEMHRGADGYRREIDTRIRALNLTTSLER